MENICAVISYDDMGRKLGTLRASAGLKNTTGSAGRAFKAFLLKAWSLRVHVR